MGDIEFFNCINNYQYFIVIKYKYTIIEYQDF